MDSRRKYVRRREAVAMDSNYKEQQMARTSYLRARFFIALLMLHLGLSLHATAYAGPETLWEYTVSGVSTRFKTLGEAEAAMRAITDKDGEMHSALRFSYVSSASPYGTTMQYRVPAKTAELGPWSYWISYSPGGPYGDEASAAGGLEDYFSSSECNATASAASGWYQSPTNKIGQEFTSFWLPRQQFRKDYQIRVQCEKDGHAWAYDAATFMVLHADATCPDKYSLTLYQYAPQLQNPPGSVYTLLSEGCTNSTAGTISQSVLTPPTSCANNPSKGNPCNPATGNKFEIETDIQLPSTTGLQFKRTYNSMQQAQYLGVLGRNWTHSYSTKLLVASTPYGLIRADGASETWRYVTTNVYASHQVQGNQLRKVGSEWVLMKGSGDREVFDLGGNLLRIEAANGLRTVLTYDSQRRLSRVEGPFGHALTLAYDDTTGKLSSVTDPLGNAVQYGYSNDNLIQVTYPDGNVRTYHYETQAFPHHLTGISDNGVRYSTFAYDDHGRAVLSEHAGGADRHIFSYNADGTTTVTDANGATSVYHVVSPTSVPRIVSKVVDGAGQTPRTYDSYWRLTSQTDRRGVKTTYAYDSYHRISMTEAVGTAQQRLTRYEYLNNESDLLTAVETPSVYPGAQKRVTTSYGDIRFPANPTVLTHWGFTPSGAGTSRSTEMVYNDNGQVAAIDGPRTDVVDVTNYAYDTEGNLTSVINALGHAVEITAQDAVGRPLSFTDPNGIVTTLSYDTRGRLASRDIGGEATTFDYNAVGNIHSIHLADGSAYTYVYDDARRLIAVVDIQGNRIDYTLDSMGNRTMEDVKDSSGTLRRRHRQVFDQMNRLVQSVGAGDQTTVYQYDANGNRTAITNAHNNTTSESFDALNRLVSTTDALNGIVAYAYDNQDHLTSVTDALGHATTYSYDDLGNLLTQTSPDTGTTTYTHDAAGNVLSKTDAKGQTTSYSYDALNRLTQITHADGQQVSYTYDSCTYGIGRLCSVSDAVGTTAWDYDSHGRLQAKHQTLGSLTLTTGYRYTTAGQLEQITYPSGLTVDYQYSQGQLTALSLSGQPFIAGLTYQPFGPVSGWVWSTGRVHSRTFDLDGQLIQQTLGDDNRALAYDVLGNITALSDLQTNLTLSYDALSRLSSANDALYQLTWSYDANGNRLSQTSGGTTTTYGVDVASNRLAHVGGTARQYDANGNLLADGTHTYTYDARNRLESIDGGATACYLYNALGQRIKKTSSQGSTVFMYDEQGQLIGEYDESGAAKQETVWLGNLPVATVQNGQTYAVHADHLGTPRVITNSSYTEVWRWDSDPFGTSQANEDPDNDGNKLTYNLRFPGQYFDAETGLHYNYFRDYDPGTGRYIESDPIGLDGGINTYAYVDNSPMGWIDPLGLSKYQPKDTVEAWCLKYPQACKELERELYKQLKRAKKSKTSGKDGAKDCPSWAKEDGGPLQNESGKDYAKRLMDEKYGPGEWGDRGPGSEYSQIQKWADRAFE